MESSITSKTVLQDTISGEVEEPIQDKIPEIAKKVLRVPNKDKEQIDDKGIRNPNYLLENNEERETKIEQTGKDLNKGREAYFDFIQSQEQKNMARTKHTAKKRTVQEDNRSSWAGPSQTGNVPRKGLIPNKQSGKERPVPPGVVGIKHMKRLHHF